MEPDKKTQRYFKEFTFLPLCFHIAKNYNILYDGTYYSNSHEYTIEKKKLVDRDSVKNTTEEINSPTQVGNHTGIVRINNNLTNYSYSGLLFFLVWAFMKFRYKSDAEGTDELTYMLLDKLNDDKFVKVDVLKDFFKSIEHCINLSLLNPLKKRYEALEKLINNPEPDKK
jgi:hypothetical protein